MKLSRPVVVLLYLIMSCFFKVLFLVMISYVYVNWIGSGQGFLIFLRENFVMYLKMGVGAAVGFIFWFFIIDKNLVQQKELRQRKERFQTRCLLGRSRIRRRLAQRV